MDRNERWEITEKSRDKETRRLQKRSRKTMAKMGGLPEDRHNKGSCRRKVERKGQQQEEDNKSRRTAEWQMTGLTPITEKRGEDWLKITLHLESDLFRHPLSLIRQHHRVAVAAILVACVFTQLILLSTESSQMCHKLRHKCDQQRKTWNRKLRFIGFSGKHSSQAAITRQG